MIINIYCRTESNREELDDAKAEIQQIKQELASAHQAGDLAQIDFHQKRLLQLGHQLSSLREQQTILLRCSQQGLPAQDLTSKEAVNDSIVHQTPILDATEQAADQVVGSLLSQGYGWLKLSKSETRSFNTLRQYTNKPASCFDQGGVSLRGKRLLQYNTGEPSSKLSPAVCTAADRVSAAALEHAWAVLPCYQSPDALATASPICRYAL